jgi:hypothetical protein
MKNVMKKLTGLLIVLVLALFAGCSDVDDGAKKDSSETKYTVSGRVLVGGTNGATASKLFSSASATRSATSSFETEYGTVSQPLQVKATKGDSSFIADVDSDGVYSLVLPEAGAWDLEISKYMYEDEALGQTAYSLYGTAEVTVSTENAEISNNDIVVYPKFYSGIKGALNLTISDGTKDSKISKVSCTAVYKTDEVLPDESAEKINGSLDFTSGSVTISQNNVPAGTYELTFSFEDASGNVLYSCKETVTVFSGWTTDTWFGESPYMQKDDDGNYSFVITDALIAGYGTETVPSTDTVLYSYASGAYNYYIANSADVKTSDSTANFTSETNSFCFDADGNVYVLVENDDNGTTSYSIKSNKTGFTETTLTESSFSNYSPSLAIDLAKNVLYVWYCHESELVIYKYPSLISTGNGTESSSFTFYGPSLTIDGETVSVWPDTCMINNEIAYIIERDTSYNDYGSFLFKAALTGTGSLDENNYVSLGLNGTSSASVTDMLYQDGAVYILARNVSSSSGIYSTGALLRYDVKFGTVKTLIGLSEPVDLSGVKLYSSVYIPDDDTSYQCYTDSSLKTPFYAPADFTWTANEEKHTIFSSLYTPSLLDKSNATLSKTGFYGPVKFVAVKPRKLVIADDGLAFYTDNDGALKYKNVSRVVTVDLESFAITDSTETDAIFGENNSARLHISFENDSDFQYEFNSSSDVFPNLEAKVYYSGNTQGVAPGNSFEVGIPCAD